MENQHTSVPPTPKYCDFRKRRKNRQKANHDKVLQSLNDNNIDDFNKHVNQKELARTLEYLDMSTVEELMTICQEDECCAKLVSLHLSKNATRQGSKDEALQLEICNETMSPYGITVENLSATHARPTKDGRIVNREQARQLPRSECLKSFDGKIQGKMNGYTAAKVVYGNGGHQDNVFEEMYTLAEWWKKYKPVDPINPMQNEFLVILIDTDLNISSLKEKYEQVSNILVFNHYEFQKYVIDNYNLL